MARTQSLPAHHADTIAISLARLLDRLDCSLLSPDANPQLRTSSYARTKVGANLEYARSLLLRIEHDTASIKVGSRRQAQQDDLQAKRELIKKLNQRLYELNQLEDEDYEDEDEDKYAEDDGADGDAPSAVAPASTTTPPESILRSRRQQQPTSQDTGTSSSLFSPTPHAPGHEPDPRLQKSETLLSHNRAEQESLTASLLNMAQSLRESSQRFSSSLEAEKDILERAGKGLDYGSEGMQAAGQRMGTLRRMTEGKGWWARVQLYAIIGGLWMALLIVMFVMPKIRF